MAAFRSPGPARQLLMVLDDAVAIVDEHTRIIGVQTDEQVLPGLSCLDGNAEMLWEIQFAPRTDGRYRAAYEEFVHDFQILNTHEASAVH